MALRFPDQGLIALLKMSVGDVSVVEALRLRLFVNNVIPTQALTEADFMEASFIGYASIPLPFGGWVIEAGDPPKISFPSIEFRAAAEQAVQTVYGYFFTGEVTGKLRGFQIFGEGPFSFSHNGDRITFPPEITGRNQ